MKQDSSSSSVLNPRVKLSQDRSSSVQDWPPFSRQRMSALSFQEDDYSEGQDLNLNISPPHASPRSVIPKAKIVTYRAAEIMKHWNAENG